MQALTINLITRYDIAVIIFMWFMFFDRHYNERIWYIHFHIVSVSFKHVAFVHIRAYDCI